jgi:hypothetical protein
MSRALMFARTPCDVEPSSAQQGGASRSRPVPEAMQPLWGRIYLLPQLPTGTVVLRGLCSGSAPGARAQGTPGVLPGLSGRPKAAPRRGASAAQTQEEGAPRGEGSALCGGISECRGASCGGSCQRRASGCPGPEATASGVDAGCMAGPVGRREETLGSRSRLPSLRSVRMGAARLGARGLAPAVRHVCAVEANADDRERPGT